MSRTAPRPRMGVVSMTAERVVRFNKPAARTPRPRDRRSGPCLLEHQPSTEALRRAFRAELLVQLQAQRDLPTQVESAARDRLLVRHGIMRLQKQRHGELRRRDARASEVLAVQCDKIHIAKPVRTLASQQSVEGLLAYVISKRVIRTEEIALRLSTT